MNFEVVLCLFVDFTQNPILDTEALLRLKVFDSAGGRLIVEYRIYVYSVRTYLLDQKDYRLILMMDFWNIVLRNDFS